MTTGAFDTTIGYIQEFVGGWVFEIGNGFIQRRIHCVQGKILTTSLVHSVNCEEYLEESIAEFEINLIGYGQSVTLESKDFRFTHYETPEWDDNARVLKLHLTCDLNGEELNAAVIYELFAGKDYMSKRLILQPCPLEGWYVAGIKLEKMTFKELVEGLTPRRRYRHATERHEDAVHVDPDEVDVLDPNKRFEYGDFSRSVITYWGYREGLYFFTESLLGEEVFSKPEGLQMRQREWAELSAGVQAGPAVIGAYTGDPEIGFKRYTEHLAKNWSRVTQKSLPAQWNTWLVTLDTGPVLFDYDRNLLIDQIKLIKEAGFIELLQLDLGWEAGKPLQADPRKFPNGISEIARIARENGLDIGFWINPFSQSYWRSGVEREHPEWTVPGKSSGRSGASALCVATDYFNEVKQRLSELVGMTGASMIYWDGNDWNVPRCGCSHHDHSRQEELEASVWKRLAELCDNIRQANPDIIITVFSLPFDNHRLGVVDQEQVSDTHSFPTLKSELIQRRQIYQMTWEHPYKAIRGSWYGVNWHETGRDNLMQRPLRELIHAEMSMIGNGLLQGGGSIDFETAKPELVDFLRKLFAFRKRFEKYFDTYQHVLGFPDGVNVDGSGHIVDGSGFIVLVNPSDSERSITLPLNEPELELPAKKKLVITDWSNLQRGFEVGTYAADKPPTVDIAPLEVKYIGINIPDL